MRLSTEDRLNAIERILEQKLGYELTVKSLEKKKIDLNICIESRILMEFCDKPDFNKQDTIFHYLTKIDNSYHMLRCESGWKHCRPMMNHIFCSPTGWNKCPIPIGYRVRVWQTTNTGELESCVADAGKIEYWSSIVMFEIIEMLEGFEL